MKKDSLIQKMIRFYAIILIFAITTFALLISVFVHRESHHQALKKVDDAMDQVTKFSITIKVILKELFIIFFQIQQVQKI